jgi:hypothetical protein
VNHAVELVGSIPDFLVTEADADLVVHDNLGEVFSDPDGDPLVYAVNCDQSNLTFKVTGQVLTVNASESFKGEATAEVVASDGMTEVSDQFKVSRDATGITDRENGAALIHCYPNPFSNRLNVELNLGNRPESGSLTLYDMSGRRMVSRQLENPAGGRQTVELNLGGQPAGSYILELVSGELRVTSVVTKK